MKGLRIQRQGFAWGIPTRMRRVQPLLTLEYNLQWPSPFSRGRYASDSLFSPHIIWLYDAIAQTAFSAQLPARSP